MSEEQTPRVSGAVLLDQVGVMEDLAGAARVQAARASLRDDQRAELEGLMPMSWCRVETANAFLEAVADNLGRPAVEFQAEVVRTGVERTFRTLWRILLRFTSDAALVRRTPLLYSKTYDRGSLRSHIVEPGHAHIELVGWSKAPELDLEGLATGIETVLRLAGRADVEVSWERRIYGAVFVARWDA